MNLKDFIEFAIPLLLVAPILAGVERLINYEKYEMERVERERRWIERVCIGGPME